LSIIILALLFSQGVSAQFKCTTGAGRCAEQNDYVCNLSQAIWSRVTTLEDAWSTSLIPRFSDKYTVDYVEDRRYCRHQGHRQDKQAQVFVQVSSDTSELKKYRVIHSACGNDAILTENWEIRGVNLEPLRLREIIFDLSRKFDLKKNETFKSLTLANDGAQFVRPENSTAQYNPFRAKNIFKYTSQRKTVLDENKILTSRIQSNFWLFNKKLFSQDLNKTLDKSLFNYYSPIYQFTLRFNRFFSPCYKAEVQISFDDYLEIRSSRDNSKYGMSFNDFLESCIGREASEYVNVAADIVENHLQSRFPIFSTNANVNRILDNRQ